jgi:hypothetical protein
MSLDKAIEHGNDSWMIGSHKKKKREKKRAAEEQIQEGEL